MERTSVRQVLLCSALTVFAAQISLRLFSGDFIVSVAAVLLPVFVMIWGEYPLLPAAALSAAGNLALRAAVSWLDTGAANIGGLWPEMVFYLVYGLLLFLLCRRTQWSFTSWRQIVPLAAIDYLSNLAELLCRGQGLRSPQVHLGLAVVAALRTALVFSVWLLLDSQRLSLLKREHAERYRQLLLLTSRLRGEIVWMRKSSAMMEDTMNTAYRLYAQLLAERHPASPQALAISKDIHEIKKEYLLVIRGLSEALEEDLPEDAAEFGKLWQILYDAERRAARHAGVTVDWDVRIETEFRTDKQFQLLSILRNLLDNAIEAAEAGHIRVAFSARRQGGRQVFTVTNWGRPIPQDALPHIFDPGFSTKVDYATGRVGRGIGLCLVRDLTERELQGTLRVDTEGGKTSFILSIPTTSLEVSPCDSI